MTFGEVSKASRISCTGDTPVTMTALRFLISRNKLLSCFLKWVLQIEGPAEGLWDKCLFDEVTLSLEAQNNLDIMGIEFVIWEAFFMKKNAT